MFLKSIQTSSAALLVCLLGIIDLKPKLNDKMECFLEEEKIIFRVLLTEPIKFDEGRMTHYKGTPSFIRCSFKSGAFHV